MATSADIIANANLVDTAKVNLSSVLTAFSHDASGGLSAYPARYASILPSYADKNYILRSEDGTTINSGLLDSRPDITELRISCADLTSVTSAFVANNPALTSITFNDGLGLEGSGFAESCFYHTFYNNTTVKKVSIPYLQTAYDYEFYNAFRNSAISSLNLGSNLSYVNAFGLYAAFMSSDLSINVSKITDIGESGMVAAFRDNTKQQILNFNALTSIGQKGLQAAARESNIYNASFPNLSTTTASCFMQFALSSQTFNYFGAPDISACANSSFYQAFRGTNIDAAYLDGVKSISPSALYQAFYGCTSLGAFPFNPASVHTIGNYALYQGFYNCSQMYDGSGEGTTLTFTNLSVVGIQGLYQAFYNCDRLTNVSMPHSLRPYSGAFNYAFDNCSNLTACTIGLSSLSSDPCLQYTFRNCTKLQHIYFPNLNTINGFNYADTTLGSIYRMCYNCNRTVTVHLRKVWSTTTLPTGETAGARFASNAKSGSSGTTVNVVYYSS